MNKKILVSLTTILALIMLIPTVMAVGPTKANIDKNKNLVYYVENNIRTLVRMINKAGVFHEWINPVGIREWIIQRRDASKVNIGNAIEGLFDTVQIPPPPPTGNVLVFLEYENKWLYLNQDQYSNMLQGFGFPKAQADGVAADFPEGVYFRVNFIGK